MLSLLSLPSVEGRDFIAHRGVNLRSTIAGENSLEAISLARRAGFRAVETDVRLSSDDSLMVMHDVTLNRTCLRSDGSKIAAKTAIADVPFASLRRDYVLKADEPGMRSQIPTLSEYLRRCRDEGIYVFIEPKLVDPSGRFYKRIIALADAILGRGNYTVTSNNKANNIIRDHLKIKDVRLMGILYQTTYDSIARLGNTVMAVSASKFDNAQFDANVARAKKDGFLTESHADNFERFAKINRNPIDYVSTDFLAPDIPASQKEYHNCITMKGIKEKQTIPLSPSKFGAVFIEIDTDSPATVTMGPQTFTIPEAGKYSHQVMVYNCTPAFVIETGGKIKTLKIKQVEY